MRVSHRSLGPILLLVACSFAACSSSTPSTAAGGHADAHSADAGSDGGASSTVCTVTAGTSGTLLRGTLLLPSGPATGELLISSAGLITCAAPSCSGTAGYASAAIVDCPDGVISPALIDSHDHSNYATISPEAHAAIRYQHRDDWRLGADGATPLKSAPETTDTATIAAQELRMIAGGATSIIGSGGVAGLARNLASYNTPTDETEGLTGATVYFDTFPLGDEDGEIDAGASVGLITSGCAYPDIEAPSSAFEGGARYAPHLAEGINLAAENEITCTTASPNVLVTSNTTVIHGVGMNATDVAKLQTAGASLVWAPRSNVSLYGNTAPLTELQYANVSIALGTDWLPTGSMNMLRELACADSFNQKYFAATFTDQQLFEMATINGAIAAGFATQLGSLTVGKLADIAVFDGSVSQGYRAVIAASSEDVRLVLRGGKVLYGDAPVVSALDSTCSAWSVCGIARAVCIDTPGIALSDLETVATQVYAITACRTTTPAGEPTCVPYRDSYPDGTSATDRDGDGIPDTADDCPTIFNPIRPMDGTTQADVDGDGVGDACDAAPLDPTKH